MNKKNKFNTAVLSLIGSGVLLSVFGFVNAQGEPPTVIETSSHIFTQMADGVYQITGTGEVFVMSNALMIVGDDDVLLVDSHVTPNAANALLRSVQAVTDKPVRYLVNSHYHFDHAHGNQVFPNQVEIIGHSFTRQKLNGELGNVLTENTMVSFTEGVPALVENLRERLEAATTDTQRTNLAAQLKYQEEHMMSLREIVPTPPNITLETKMTLYQDVGGGSREIQILHLGKAHTAGDVVVFLPAERLVFTGDMMLPFLAYMGDSHPVEWVDTLEALKDIEFDVILPGHGAPFQDKEIISHFQAYLTDLWQKTEAMKARGMTVAQTAAQIDLSNHAQNYAQLSSPGADPRAIQRIYTLLDQ
ncbi:MAG: MBL fold metallo-hydrolase [Gammaproteobacteria bacterium]